METQYTKILEQIQTIDPIKYGKTRNYINGSVTKLSPYISRGMISTKQIMDSLLEKYTFNQCERFFQQLAWRDYFQRVAQHHTSLELVGVKNNQQQAAFSEIPVSVLTHTTGITAIDEGISKLYSDGWMHNHVRMYVASIVCNVAKTNWQIPSKWMYYHLFDADYAANFLSWQWVCGAFSSKLYYANQENINKYAATNDQNTFVDVDYEAFPNMDVPHALKNRTNLTLKTVLPQIQKVEIELDKPVLLYNYYNIDPAWHSAENVNRILILEPSHFDRFPISEKNLQFFIELSKNIPQIQIFVGEFSELSAQLGPSAKFIFKEHPLFQHYEGQKEDRDWMFPEITGLYSSFFKFWQAVTKNKFKHINKLHA